MTSSFLLRFKIQFYERTIASAFRTIPDLAKDLGNVYYRLATRSQMLLWCGQLTTPPGRIPALAAVRRRLGNSFIFASLSNIERGTRCRGRRAYVMRGL